MYHSVLPEAQAQPDPYGVTVSTARLDRQLRWLRRRGLRGVSVDRLLRAVAAAPPGDPSVRRLVGLTFDDGYADFLTHALPLLRAHRCTATLFVLPGRLGGHNAWDTPGPKKRLLTADGIRAVAEAGMEIGSHGLSHVSLPGLADDDALRAETADSRALLREITGQEVAGFCYPYGHVDARSVGAVRAAGYDYACAIDTPRALAGSAGRHALPRVHVGSGDTTPRLHLKRLLQPVRRRAVTLS
ncbi:polysaccharide deacetylase family protein [Streptomyces sp. 4N509B]|uniref:polysaccharide deacetylase family protein n=1 Tax=Streptomyces sp. 4N509B TaxID=3457413 RepID=UPI003FD60C33